MSGIPHAVTHLLLYIHKLPPVNVGYAVAAYTKFDPTQKFTPIVLGMETAGFFGPEAFTLVKELGYQIRHISAEERLCLTLVIYQIRLISAEERPCLTLVIRLGISLQRRDFALP